MRIILELNERMRKNLKKELRRVAPSVIACSVRSFKDISISTLSVHV